jgi:hypothetical protein
MNKRRIFLHLLYLLFAAQVCTVPASAQDLDNLDLKRPFKFSGNIGLQLESYTASGISNRKQPFTWVLSGSPMVEILGVQLPFSFLFSNFENKYFQPFNQFGLSPTYKWITLHLGYRNVQFSPFTLAGHRMLGAGVELRPGRFRFGFMYGRLNKGISPDSLSHSDSSLYPSPATYTRMAYAVKIGVGSEKSYFDISYLKGWDQTESVDARYRDSVPAQENNVIGLSWQITLFKKLVWKTDAGLSIYTNDISSPVLMDSTAPETARKVSSLFTLRTSTQYLLAGETRIGWRDRDFGVDLVYRRIDPDYKSMGAYFFQADLQQYTVTPYLKLYQGKLLLNGSVGIQNDNLYGMKLATAKRFIGNFNINYNPSQTFGLNANYSNYGITQNPVRVTPEVAVFKQVSQNFTIVPYVNLVTDRNVKSLTLAASYQLLNAVSTTLASPDQNTILGTLTYVHTINSSGLNGNASLTYNNTTITGQGQIGSYGAGVGAGIPIFKNKTTINLNGQYSTNFFNSTANGYTINADAGCTVPLYKKHSLQLAASYLNNMSKDESFVQTFSEYIFRINYNFRF